MYPCGPTLRQPVINDRESSGGSAHDQANTAFRPDASQSMLSRPKSDDASTRYDEASSHECGDIKSGTKSDEIDDLPNDEEYRDVESDNAPKFDGREVYREAISE